MSLHCTTEVVEDDVQRTQVPSLLATGQKAAVGSDKLRRREKEREREGVKRCPKAILERANRFFPPFLHAP